MSVLALRTVKEMRAEPGRRVAATRPDAATYARLLRLLADAQALADYWRQRCATAEHRRSI